MNKIPDFLISAREAVNNPDKKLLCPYCQQNAPLLLIDGAVEINDGLKEYNYLSVFKCNICGEIVSAQKLTIDIDEAISHYMNLKDIKIDDNPRQNQPLLGQDYSGKAMVSHSKTRNGYGLSNMGWGDQQGIRAYSRKHSCNKGY